ncbi:hypothetical protein DFQ26_007607 [Actinomortierella ambigua]|nr:hypothetical protein DFQ26_007607 [Actinomortierella ambigua]
MSVEARAARKALAAHNSSSRNKSTSSLTRLLRSLPVLLLFFLCTFCSAFASAAPVDTSSKAPRRPGDNDDINLRDGPYNLTAQSAIAGVILIICGLLLCFFGYRLFHLTMFLIGFYLLGNVTYIAMANAGVTSQTLLLVISLIVGIIGGLLLLCCSRLGVAILGALAMYSLGLWILGWRHGGTITTDTGRGIFLGVLAVVGFLLGCFREREVVIIGSAIVGAYSFVIGVDMFARTGFTASANRFINSRSEFEWGVSKLSGGEIALLVTFLLMAIAGAVTQWMAWRRRTFYPANTGPYGNVVYTEKPSRLGGFFRRRR